MPRSAPTPSLLLERESPLAGRWPPALRRLARSLESPPHLWPDPLMFERGQRHGTALAVIATPAKAGGSNSEFWSGATGLVTTSYCGNLAYRRAVTRSTQSRYSA